MENRLSESIVSYLNELYEADPIAIKKLINTSIECNDIIANHPRLLTKKDKKTSYISFLGILNGIKEINCSIARTSGEETFFVVKQFGGNE